MTMPQPLPIPDDFPVTWDRPGDEQLFWAQDVMHQPYPITPLNETLHQPAFSEGASRAVARLSMPVDELRYSVHNGYSYFTARPVMLPPEEMDARFQEMQRITIELGSTVLQDWRQTFEPRVLALCDGILQHDYDALTTADLARYVTSFYDIQVEFFDIHMRVNIPPMNAVFGFEEFLSEFLDQEAVMKSRLLQAGFDNKSVQYGGAIWDLSRWVREDQDLATLVKATQPVDGAVSLNDHPRASEFNERWQAFTKEYGWRSDFFFEIGEPSWWEDQSTLLSQFKHFLGQDDSADPYANHRRHAEGRDALAAEFEARLPEPAVPQFRAMLPLVQQYIPIAEDHNFTIDQKSTAVIRFGVQQLGKRLALEGELEDSEDVFYLHLDEIDSIAGGASASAFKDQIGPRRQTRRDQQTRRPPMLIGTPPPPDAPADPLVTKFFGLGAEASTDARTLKGNACSAGQITGTTKVVLSLDESDKLEPGDIMVCPMTMPPWTPLFDIVGAVVADSGGVLSHCAIVAREYGIPCVAGTMTGTQAIKDGMTIRVDGTAGTVEIIG